MVSAVVASLVGGVEDAPPAAEPAAPPAEVKYFILPFLPTIPRVALGAAPPLTPLLPADGAMMSGLGDDAALLDK